MSCSSTGKRSTSTEQSEQTLYVRTTHFHPHHVDGAPENDLAVIELHNSINYKKDVFPACLPERDFADQLQVLSAPTIITGWKESKQEPTFQGPLTLNHLTYSTLQDCVKAHPNLITNKMGCTAPRASADCVMSSGSPVLTLYKDVTFLTGVVSQPIGANCTEGYIVQRVSRYLGWLKQLMSR